MSAIPLDTPNTSKADATPGTAVQRHEISIIDRIAWRDAAIVWLCQRLLFAVVTYLGVTLTRILSYSQQRIPWDMLFRHWLGWDGSNYAVIAEKGYAYPWTPAFFPLFPALEHVMMPLLGGNAALAGVLIANLACLAAFGLLRVLAERESDRATAQRTLLYLAVFPTAFFLAAPYTESLFLLLSVGAFLALRRRHWLLAGVLAALATLTRSVGILLLLPLLMEWGWRARAANKLPSWRGWRNLVGVAVGVLLPVAAFVGFTLYLRQHFGSFNVSTQAQAADWGRGFDWPFVGFARAANALLSDGLAPNFFQVHALLDILFTLLFIALTIATIRRLHPTYVVYAFASLLLILCTPAHNWYALESNMRFMLVVFPLFLLLARWGARRPVEQVVLALSLPLLALFLLTFAIGSWIA